MVEQQIEQQMKQRTVGQQMAEQTGEQPIVPARQRKIWFMSNRQPWTEAVVSGIIRTKTRNKIYMKPGDIVFLHASKADWDGGWHNLAWMAGRDIKSFPHGGVYAVASIDCVGDTLEVMPPEDADKFLVYDDEIWICAMRQSVVFKEVLRLPFVPVPGRQTIVSKLPQELVVAIETIPEYAAALKHFSA